jgi:hypothetical protein
MKKLYSDGNFAGVFAALSPDEDIAEIHRYYVLKHNTAHNLTETLTLPDGEAYDVLQNLTVANNSLKEKCLVRNKDK